MGGRGSAANITLFGAKYGTRLSPEQYKGAVTNRANFILRDLEQNDAVQIIIKRGFKNGVPIVEVSDGGIDIIVQRGLVEPTITQLEKELDSLKTEHSAAVRAKKESKLFSAYDEARAVAQVTAQAMKALSDALYILRKRR